MKYRSEVKLVIEWEPSQGSDGSSIESFGDLVSYVENTVVSNAEFDKLNLTVIRAGGTAKAKPLYEVD